VRAATYHVAPSGSDATPCATATSASTPRQTLNGGLACLAGGDTLLVATGTYLELLVAGPGGADVVRPVQPNVIPIPNGLSASQPTTIRAADGAAVWLKPTVTYPGGGGIVTTLPGAQYLAFRGLHLDGQDQHEQALWLKGSHITYSHAEITRSKYHCVSSQTDSDAVTFSHLHIHHCGLASTMTPPPHGMYLCGTNKVVEYSSIHHTNNRGIQLSCEQGGISGGRLRLNRIADVKYGIQLQGNDNETHDNVIERVGMGIWIGGGNGGIIRNNTIYQYQPVLSDTYGILAASSSGPVLRDNILMQMEVVSSTSYNRYIYSTGSAPQMSGQMFDVQPAGGLQPQFVATAAAVFVDAPGGDFRLKAGSPAIGVGHNGGNLGASIPDAPDPPDPPDPPQPPDLPPLVLEYSVSDGGWQFAEELASRSRDICMRLTRGPVRVWQVCGFAPGAVQ
jgi:hypothetical protein